MVREDVCPECGVEKMKPTRGTAKISDPDTGTVTTDYQEYKCDNCGYPEGGHQKVVGVNEDIKPKARRLSSSSVTSSFDLGSKLSHKPLL